MHTHDSQRPELAGQFTSGNVSTLKPIRDIRTNAICDEFPNHGLHRPLFFREQNVDRIELKRALRGSRHEAKV
jgi:hypothetical protein